MALGANFNNLINIIYQSVGAEKVTSDIDKVDTSLNSIKWDSARHDATVQDFNTIGQASDVVNGKITKSKSVMNEFGLAMRRALIVAPVWMAMRAAMQAVFNLIKDQGKFLIEMETALAHIQIVGKGTAEEYTHMKTALVALAQAYGTSASEAMEAAKIFAQQGRTVAETIQLTRIAMVAANVLGADLKTTVDNLTAAVEGFAIPVENSISVVDKWINVERQFAVTAQDLADATKRAGATANQLGISIDSFLGHVTGIIEVTRKSGSEAGNSLQFMYARILTTGKQTIEQIARVPIYMDATGKATNQVTGAYRNAGDILDDVAAKWSTLTEKQKLDIATGIASKRQMTSFLAMMQNYNNALLARIASLSSAGQAEKALGIISETTAYKQKQLTASWNLLTTAIANTDVFKAKIDAVNALVLGFAALVNKYALYRAELTKQYAQQSTEIEKGKSEIVNLKELLKLRESYSKAASTPANNQMLDTITKAIEKLKNSSSILISIDTKDIDAANKKLDETFKIFTTRSVVREILLEFQPKREKLEDEIQSLVNDIAPIEAGGFLGNLLKSDPMVKKLYSDYEKKQKELIELEKEQGAETNKRVKARLDGIKAVKDEVAASEASKAEEIKLTEIIIKNEMEKLTIRGASERTLLEQEARLHDALGLIDQEGDKLKRKLDMEMAISKEKLNQNKISSDAMKIYEVAQKYGESTAIDIAGALQGRWGGIKGLDKDALEVFKTEFADTYKTYQANEFYKYNSYLRNLIMPTNTSSLDSLTSLISKYSISGGTTSGAESSKNKKISSLSGVDGSTSKSTQEKKSTLALECKIDVNLSGEVKTTEDLKKSVTEMNNEIQKGLTSPGSPMYKAVEDIIEKY
jgi:TP901 family phage tail tape measure protein